MPVLSLRLLPLLSALLLFSKLPVCAQPLLPAPISGSPLAPEQKQRLAEAEQLLEQGNDLYQQGKYEEAIVIEQQVLTIRREILGKKHPLTITSLNNLAELYYSQGNYAAAEPLYLQALAIAKDVLGETHPFTAGSLNNLAA
ncbi:MAG: tetratricopeptide repeat protein, partial [Synechocystis sp.]